MLPYERIAELIENMINHKISVGSIYNFLSENSDKLEAFEEQLKRELLGVDALHVDETGVNVKDKLEWIYTATSNRVVDYTIHNKF